MKNLIESAPAGGQNLQGELSPEMEKYQRKLRLIYKCFSSWIEEKLIEPTQISNSQLFGFLFRILCDSNTELDLHDVVTTCLVNILLMYPVNDRVNVRIYTIQFNLDELLFNNFINMFLGSVQKPTC